MQRYLLKINLTSEHSIDMLFPNWQDMKDFIKQRDFYFVNADYSTYDLAIQLK